MLTFLALSMFVVACIALLRGYNVAFTLGGVGVLFAGLGTALGVFDSTDMINLPDRIYPIITREILIAVPLFVFMGVMLEKSKIAEELLESMGDLLGPMRGGLGISVVFVGALLAASTGIVGATVVTMGLLSLSRVQRLPAHFRPHHQQGQAPQANHRRRVGRVAGRVQGFDRELNATAGPRC